MECRKNCGACCIAPSISSKIPGMDMTFDTRTNKKVGKPAGVRCIHLTEDFRCAIFTHPDRPEVCDRFKAEPEICGENRQEALTILFDLEGIEIGDNIDSLD